MRARALVLPLVAFLLVPAEAASADGLPIVGIDARPVSVRGADLEYVTKRAGRDTLLLERRRRDERVLRRLRIAGNFSIPAVAYDGSPSGLSADGRTLALINPRMRFPRARTTIAVVDANRLRLRRKLTLRGDYSFDAFSPDARLMYLIEYLAPHDITKYDVRAFDMRASRLLPEPIVDPGEPGEDMYGLPMTRAAGLDGRWEYTLYESHHHPFIHALDTENRRAVCIDLEERRGGMWGLKLKPRPGRLDVLAGARVVASIDTGTHEVVRKQIAGHSTPWLAIAGPTAALVLLGAAAGRRRRARRASATRTAEP